jgi:hypothetical protein
MKLPDETTPTPEQVAGPEESPAAEPVVKAGPTIKTRKPKQRACDERNEKGQLCAGHLKRWFDLPAEVAAIVGKGAEVYRCEFCKMIYRPDPQQQPNSYTVRY